MGTPVKRTITEMESTPPDALNTPIFNGRFDRICTSCGAIVMKAALRKYVRQKCDHCKTLIDGRKDEQRIWDHCVDCDSILMYNNKFCYNCGESNVHYDPSKAARLERQMKCKIVADLKDEIRKELQEEIADEKAMVETTVQTEEASHNSPMSKIISEESN